MRISGWLFLVQQIFTVLVLLMTSARWLRIRLPAIRMLIASAICGSAVAAGCFLPVPWHAALAAAAFLTAPRLAGFRLPRTGRFRLQLLSVMLTLLCTGLLRALQPAVIPQLLPFCTAAMLLLPAIDRRTPALSCATVIIHLSDRQVRLTALLDSGNLLRDPLTGLPVIVCSRRALSPLNLLKPRLRLIAVRTAAGQALMPVFRPTSVRLLTGGTWRDANALIGIAPESYNGFQALVPVSLTTPAALPTAMSS